MNGVIISDQHFGVIDPKKLLKEHETSFFQYISSLEELDIIIITGDYFDKNLHLNDVSSMYAMMCMKTILYFAKKYNAKVRIVYGTESHECNQYSIFNLYSQAYSQEIDFKVVSFASEEELLPGINVLYIPEEYIYDKKEYYDEFLSKENHYDYIFGHGVIQEVMTNAVRHSSKNKESDNIRAKVPVFSSAELSYACKGQVFFGHYHENTNMNDKVFYVGSYSRWIFGEEKPKGFYHITHNNDKYNAEFIENIDADKYITLMYGYEHKIFKSLDNFNVEMKSVEKNLEDKIYHHVRLIFNIPETYDNPEFLINLIREKFKFNDLVKTEITNGYIDAKLKVDKEQIEAISQKYQLIFDKSAPMSEKYSFFIKEKRGVYLPIQLIEKYLNTDDIIKMNRNE